ncbi:MAG: hypothetical protein R3F59_05260 [Myxococcota bacterium]
MPRLLRPALHPVTRYVLRWFARKYALDLEDPAHELALRAELDRLRTRLAEGPRLFGAFSYADIASASFLQGIRPVDDRWLPLGPATRAAWTKSALADDYADLLAWRDRCYTAHRVSVPPR